MKRVLFSVYTYMNYIPEILDGHLEIFEFAPVLIQETHIHVHTAHRPCFFYTLNLFVLDLCGGGLCSREGATGVAPVRSC